jgi:hypothetical protein
MQKLSPGWLHKEFDQNRFFQHVDFGPLTMSKSF